MKILTFTAPVTIDYPVGITIQNNLPVIKKMVTALKKITEYKDKNFNFVCRGSSGAIIAAIFATKFPRSYISHIKKAGEHSHDFNSFHRKWDYINVIVDD